MLSAVVATVEQLAGMDVATAESGVDALSPLERVDVDGIVCDYGMPGMPGIDLLTAVRSRFGGLPFVLLPGRGSERVAAAATGAGVTDYVTIEDGWPERLAASLEDVRQFDAGGLCPTAGPDGWCSRSSPTGSTCSNPAAGFRRGTRAWRR